MGNAGFMSSNVFCRVWGYRYINTEHEEKRVPFFVTWLLGDLVNESQGSWRSEGQSGPRQQDRLDLSS